MLLYKFCFIIIENINETQGYLRKKIIFHHKIKCRFIIIYINNVLIYIYIYILLHKHYLNYKIVIIKLIIVLYIIISIYRNQRFCEGNMVHSVSKL